MWELRDQAFYFKFSDPQEFFVLKSISNERMEFYTINKKQEIILVNNGECQVNNNDDMYYETEPDIDEVD